jgi:hypothetical protein
MASSCISLGDSKSAGTGYIETYQHKIVADGTLGKNERQLLVDTIDSDDRWEILGPHTMTIGPDRSFWIDDPRSMLFKRFSDAGRIVTCVSIPDVQSTDNFVITENGELILISPTDNGLIKTDSNGKIIQRSEGMPILGSTSAMFLYDSCIFLSYYTRQGDIGIRILSKTLQTVETWDSLVGPMGRIWASSGGCYSVRPFGRGHAYTEADLVKYGGAPFLLRPDTSYIIGSEVGMDRDSNLFLFCTRRNPNNIRQYYVRKYDPSGQILTCFEIPYPFSMPEAHFLKVDKTGIVYLLEVVLETGKWVIHSYSAR